MVPDGRLGGEERRVGGVVLLVRETVLQKDIGLDAAFQVVGGLGLETGVCWRYNLAGEQRARTTRSRKGRDEYRFCINVLEMLRMVIRAFVIIVIRRELGKPC